MLSQFLDAVVTDHRVTQKLWKIIIGIFEKNEGVYQCTQYVKWNLPYRWFSGYKDIWFTQHISQKFADKVDTLSLNHPVVVEQAILSRH